MSGESGWTLPSACLAVRAGVQTADGERPALLQGPVVIDPVFSSAWAPLITFLALLSAQNIGDVSAQKGVEFMFRSGTVGFFAPHSESFSFTYFKRFTATPLKKFFFFCCICVWNSIISLD